MVVERKESIEFHLVADLSSSFFLVLMKRSWLFLKTPVESSERCFLPFVFTSYNNSYVLYFMLDLPVTKTMSLKNHPLVQIENRLIILKANFHQLSKSKVEDCIYLGYTMDFAIIRSGLVHFFAI